MNRGQWTRWDLLAALLLALIVAAEFRLSVTLCLVEAEDAQVEAVMAAAQERVDNYLATLPAQERPVVVSVPLAATAAEPDEPETPEWYIETVPLEPELQRALWDACGEFGIDYHLALAVIEQETDFRNLCGDGGQSIGYFQVQPRWWAGLMEEIGVDDLTDPVDNFRGGCAILAQLLGQYGGSVEDALTAYNTGRPGRSEYARAVMERVREVP